ASRLTELHDGSQVRRGSDDGCQHERLLDEFVFARPRHLGRVVNGEGLVASMDDEFDVRRSGDQLKVELSLEPLFHDVHVEQSEEPAAESEPEGQRGLRLINECGVRQLQLVEGVPKQRVVASLCREESAPDHRLRVPVAEQRIGRRVGRERDGISDLGVADVLDPGHEVAHVAETLSTSSGPHPTSSASSLPTSSGSAAGRSILFSAGTIVSLASRARWRFARVCASIPCAASTSRIAPSHAARLRETSYVKSTWPGVSIRLSSYSRPPTSCLSRTAWALMVIPRSRSRSMRSRYCSRIWRSATAWVRSRKRSARVDLPWSMWATMQKLRMRDWSIGSVRVRGHAPGLGPGRP